MNQKRTSPAHKVLRLAGILGVLPILMAISPAFAQSALSDNVVDIGIIWDPITFDPHVASSSEYGVIDNMYEPLVYYRDESSEIIPWLAESWEVSDDATQYTFHLRSGVRFHDGSLLDAETVKANIDRITTLKSGPYWVLDSLREVEVLDANTIRFSFEPGGPPVLASLPLIRIVSAEAIRENAGNDNAQTFLTEHVAGSGPYRLESFLRGDRVVLRYFPEYWQGWTEGQFTQANMLIIPEASTQSLMVERGDLDVAYRVPTENLPALAASDNTEVITAEGRNVLYLRLNTAVGPTSDVQVRQALAFAFDYEGFIAAMAGSYESQRRIVPPGLMDGNDVTWPYSYDIEKATELLRQAGYSENSRGRITIDVLSGFQDQLIAAQLLEYGAEQTGLLDVDIRLNEWAAMLRDLVAWGDSRDPSQVRNVFGLWTGARIADPYAYLWYMYHTDAQGGQGRNLGYFESDAVDALVEEGAQAPNRQDQLAAYAEAEQLIIDEAVDIVVGVQTSIYVIQDSLKGFFVHPGWYPAVQVFRLSR